MSCVLTKLNTIETINLFTFSQVIFWTSALPESYWNIIPYALRPRFL